MQINKITDIQFGRQLTKEEKPKYSKDINQAFNYLGIKNRALIIHGSSFPSIKIYDKRNIDGDYFISNAQNKNNYIGTPYFSKDFTDFVQMNGFNCIQLGPNGKLNKADTSPYHSSIYAKNELFLDFGKLRTKEYASLLNNNDLLSVTLFQKNISSNYDMTNFEEAENLTNILTTKAYKTFLNKLKNKDKDAINLNNQFNDFKKENNYWLEKDSIFRVLSKIHGTDEFTKWDNDIDKNLVSLLDKDDKVAKARLNQLKSDSQNKFQVGRHKFIQFLIFKQEQEDKIERQERGIKYIGDVLVGFSQSDVWANPDAFLQDWKMGAPDGGPNNTPQQWNIPVLNPNKLFNEDGTLGVAGKLLTDKITNTLRGVENIRIDNAMGLVDPFIYKLSAVRSDGTIPEGKCDNISKINDIDPNKNFQQVIHKIILPTLRRYNIDPHGVIWEDLGASTQIFRDIFYDGKFKGKTFEDEKQKGIMYSIGICMEHQNNYNYSFLSTHDNEPSVRLLSQDWIYHNEGWNPMYLAGYLIPTYNKEQLEKASAYCKEIEKNPHTRFMAKFAELFRGTPNIEISFADLFGINRIYNHAGVADSENWKLRLNSDYEDTYYKALENEKSYALNMPELLSIAVNSKKGMEISKGKISEREANSQIGKLQENLSHWSKVLKEKS